MHLCMYEHDAFNQRNTPKARLNEILYIEKMLLPSLSCRLLPELTSRKNRLIAYYVLYRINIAGVYTGVCENRLNGS